MRIPATYNTYSQKTSFTGESDDDLAVLCPICPLLLHSSFIVQRVTRTGCIEIQVRSNLDRGQFLALYLVRRTNFWVSCVLKILFAYTKDTSGGSLDTEPLSWFGFADTDFMYHARPCNPIGRIDHNSQIYDTLGGAIPLFLKSR